MWNWYSGDESQASGAPPTNPSAGTMSVADLTEQLAQTQQLVAQLKDLIREKDNELRKKDQDLKEEKECSESKVSKAKLQNKAKIASLTSQLEDLKKQVASSGGGQGKKPENKKGFGDGDQANRGKILVLRKRVEELEAQLSLKNEELQKKEGELEAQRLRGSELDVIIAAKEEKLAKKEEYIKHLQASASSDVPEEATTAVPVTKVTANDSVQDLQVLIQNLTRKVEESEEKYSLLHEQTESLKAFLNKEKSSFQEKEAMYMENIRVYQNMILEKDKEMKLLSEKHDQELFKIAAKSDSTAELHQLLKALKQKLHEDEEVLSGKNQVIDVLQKELDNKDQQITEMAEKSRLLQSEKQNLQSKLDAEKHVMRAQLKDMMGKHETEMQALNLRHSAALQEIKEKHQGEMQENYQTIQQLQNQLQGLASPGDAKDGSAAAVNSAVIKLQDEVKLKKEEASKSDAKLLKMKAWSKSRIRQLEEELKISEAKNRELSALTALVGELEDEKKALEMKLESLTDLQSINEQLLTKLVVYEEQQRILQADLEQVTKRADSQTSESGSADELQNPLEWSGMSQETDVTPDQERDNTSVMGLRIAQIEEEREAMDSRQVELEEELSAARGQGKLRTAQRKGSRGSAKLQDEFNFRDKNFEEQNLATERGEIEEGENMGGLGLRAVVEELEMERNQLQEQIMNLEERCQELEDRLQLQLRIESLQSENERFQTQLAQIRQQQSQEAEKLHDLISTLNDQLKGLTNRNAFLESAIVEKEQNVLDVTEKLNKMNRVSKTLQEKEALNKDLLEKLDQYEHQLEEVTRRQQASESENSALKMANAELTEKVSAFKDRVSVQDLSLEKLQVDLDQTNDELDRLNTSHLEKQSQLLHDLQRCEREIDGLKDLLQEKDREMSSLSASLTEYSEQVTVLKETIDFKEEQMSEMSNALVKMERELHHLREAQTLDVQESSSKILSLSDQLSEVESELNKAKQLNESKMKEAEELMRQLNENDKTIKSLRLEIQTQAVTHNNHLTECSAQIANLKEQMNASVAKVDETEIKHIQEVESLKLQIETDHSEKERLTVLLEEKSTREESFHNELKSTKEQYNKLVSELSKKDEEIKELLNLLSEQKGQSGEELIRKQEELSSLQLNLVILAQSKEELVKNLQEKTEEFQKEINAKTEVISKLHSEAEALRGQTKGLETSLADKETVLKTVMNSVEELERKIHSLEDQNRQVSKEKESLLSQVSQKESEISAMTQTLQDIQKKFSEKEQELSDLQNMTTSLVREKEDLQKEIELISAQNFQNKNTTAAEVEEKAKECLNLENRLRKEQEAALKLQTQIRSLKQNVKESRAVAQQKEEALKAKTSDYDTAYERLKQNEKKNMALEKQVEELSHMVESKNQVLEEKDTLLTTQSVQIEEIRKNLDRLQSEEQALREVNKKVTENEEKLNMAFGKLQQDLDLKVVENAKIMEEVEAGRKEIDRLTLEKESCMLSISDLEAQQNTLRLQSQSTADSLNQQLNVIKMEKEKLNSDIEMLKTTLSNKSEEVSVLSSHSSQQGHTILSLKDQIDLLQIEKGDLLRSIEEKDALLLQKEELIQQTEKKLEGEGHYLQTISALQNELQSSVSDCTQRQQRIVDQEQELQKLSHQMQLLKNKSEEAELLKIQLAEHVKIISELHSQLKNLKDTVGGLNRALAEKDECLKEKVDSYANVKAQLSELQDTLDEQRKATETLLQDNTQFKAAVSEKDLTIKNSLSDIEELKEKFRTKEEQCDMLIKQVTALEETNTKQLTDVSKLSASLEAQETLHRGKEETLNAELEQIRNVSSALQKTVDELSSKVKFLEQSVSEKDNAVQNLQEKHASLYEQKQELVESNIHKEAEISKLLNSASEKDARLQMLESNIQAFASEVNLLREELDKGSSNVKNISEALKLKDDIISQHQKAEEGLRSELQSVKVEYQETTTQQQALLLERDEARALVQTLQDKCTSQSQSIDNLKQDIDNLNTRLLQDQQTVAHDILQINQQLEREVQEKLQLEKILQILQMERESSLAMLQNELTDKNAVIGNLERQVQEAEARVSSGAESLNLLRAETADLQKTVTELSNKVKALEESVLEKENTVQNLQEKYASLYEQKQELADSNSRKEADISKLLSSASEKDARLQMLESNVQAFASEVNLLRGELDKGSSNVKNISEALKLKDDIISQCQKAEEILRMELHSVKVEYQETSTQLQTLIREREESQALVQTLQDKCQHIENLKQDADNLNSRLLQDQHTSALDKQHISQQLESSIQEKLELEKCLQSLQVDRDSSLATLQNELVDKNTVIVNLERQIQEAEERVSSVAESLNVLQVTNSDLQKQVSAQAEENYALKVHIENLKLNLSELQQQSEKEVMQVNEENGKLREENDSLGKDIKVKEEALQSLLKDLNFVDNRLCALCDENYSECEKLEQQYGYRSKLEKFSMMLCVASDYKSRVAELKEELQGKDREIEQKTQSILLLEKERDLLLDGLQKVKEQSIGNESLMEELKNAKATTSHVQSILQEKENVIIELNTRMLVLQEEIRISKEELENTNTLLNEEKTKIVELIEDVNKKNVLAQDLHVQVSQQKELISTLSDQIKEKDASLMQVMEAMSSEMVKFTDEKNVLSVELKNLQSDKSYFLSQISELTEKFEACEKKLQQSEQVLADKELYLSKLVSEKDLQSEKFSKERENLKRKLQAALVIRKDLMQKIEKLEQSKQDELRGEQMKMSELEGTVEELNGKLEAIRMENEDLQAQGQLAKQELLKKDAKISELLSALSEKEQHLVQLQNNVSELQQSFSEKDNMCQEYLRTIQEKEQNLHQTKYALKDKLKSLEEENIHLLENLENLKICLEKVKGQTSSQMSPEATSSVDPDSTSAEASFSHAENSIVHNNVHASLLCSQGNSESKEKHGGILQSLNKSIKEFELLQKAHLDLQHSYNAKFTECEREKEQVHTLQQQVQAQQELLFQKETELNNKELEVEDHKKRIEEVSHRLQELKAHEKAASELTMGIHEKDAELLRVNSEHTQLLNEMQILKAEVDKLSRDIQQHQEQTHFLTSLVSSKSVELEHCEIKVTSLQKELDVAHMMIESNRMTIQQLTSERDSHLETCQVNQSEISTLKHSLELKVVELLEKDKEVAASNDSLHLNLKIYEEDMERMRCRLKEHQEESNTLKSDYKQVKEELEEAMSKLEKAKIEVLDLRAKLTVSNKDGILMVQSSIQPLHSPGLSPEFSKTKSTFNNLQEEGCNGQPMCETCSKKQAIIGDLEKQIISTNKINEDHQRKLSEESSSKEQLQRKLQAALVSRKDLLKENKTLKQNIQSLTRETEELNRSLSEIQEKQLSEISLLTEQNNDLMSKKERLSLVNENLSAACESLKSTMESIVQEKEAFSFQLNSLTDSQTVELTGWKAKHGELNKEYESLLQAYENISDEIDKMRHVIDITKKEKNEVVMKYHDLQSENQGLVRQIEESDAEMDKLRTTLESKEIEMKKFKLENERLLDTVEKTSLVDELSQQNGKLTEENKRLREICENLKTSLDSKEKENNSISVIKTALDKLQMDMNMYRSDVEVKMSELSTENETLAKTVTELETRVQDTEQSLEKNEVEKLSILETLNSTDQLLKQENTTVQKLEADLSNMELDKMKLNEKVRILEADKVILLEEIESIQEQFCKVKNERENLEMELLKVVKNNSLLSDKFKSLQAQTHTLSQQVESLRAEKNSIVREKEEHQLQVLRDLEQRIKYAQDDSRGTKTKSKELQELLKEKQQEINQLQRDSIRFQELLLDLEGALKESNNQNDMIKKELDCTSAQLTQARSNISILDKELSNLRGGKKQVDKKHLLSSENLVNKESNNKFSKPNVRNGIDRNELEIGLSYEPKETVLQNMALEKWPLPEVTDVELKALKDIITENEQEIQKLKLEGEKVRIDIQKQVTMSQHMKQIIDNKDKEISMLISSKDGEISSYLEQIQSQYRKQAEDYEHRLSSVEAEKAKSVLECRRVEKEYETLKLKYEKAEKEKASIANEIEAFRKSISSLQTDRDQLSSDLQTISQRNERVLSQKDNIIVSAVDENSNLKEELRKALNKVDDLNAENAMLAAQLIRYREDLNQVLSLKDEQLKELLKQKLELIKNLEQQKCDLEKTCRDMQSTIETLQNSAETLEVENQKLTSKVKDQEGLIAAINKEKLLEESRKKYKDDQVKSDLDLIDFEQNDDQWASENDKADENASEAYWGLFHENKQLKAQNESFGKAMAALQDNRDSLIDDFKELQWRYASELKAEKIRGDDLESQLRNFKSQIYVILKNNTLLSEHLATEDQITVDHLAAAIDSLCNSLTNKGLEVTSLSSECATYAQQMDAFSKAMASLQHDRERLLQMLKEGTVVKKSKQDDTSVKEVITEHELNMNLLQPDKLTQVTELINNSTSESQKLRTRIQELERLLLEAKSVQDKLEKEITGYQYELSELRVEKNVLVAEAEAVRHQFGTVIAEKDRQIVELQKIQEPARQNDKMHKEKGVERMALAGSPAATGKGNLALEDKEQTKNEMQRYLHEIRQRDLIIQQLNTKAMESVEVNSVLSSQLKSVSQGLKDTQMRYTDLQNQYYKLQRDLPITRVTNQNDTLTEVPPGAPQERANVLVEIDNAELAELRRRLAQAELRRDATQQELAALSDRLAEEKAQREAAEEALQLTEQHNKRLETKSSSGDYEFSLQMESDDEREALIIDPTQNVALRTIKSCNVAVRRWLHGRSLYCSKLLTTRSKSRYLFLTYLLGLHVLILMCLTGAL
ncbi:golgin subfamily B member 1-like isoform X2 [Hyla sarda]|uniref:golgin subfamily B member 1-like isoform X2 n=1 Tax=Hyla sarda TaxID=327740 RepID=UPI0024C44754|nr:golgin subfamily B member 1-like isoform X2 [Hyla sarda]